MRHLSEPSSKFQSTLSSLSRPRLAPRKGFCAAILGVLRVRAEGFISFGPPCGSYVWINRATSGRSQEHPYGDESKPYVNKATMNLVFNLRSRWIFTASNYHINWRSLVSSIPGPQNFISGLLRGHYFSRYWLLQGLYIQCWSSPAPALWNICLTSQQRQLPSNGI